MRTQTTTLRTGRKTRLLIIIAAVLALLAAAVLVWRLAFYEAPFVPPEYDATAQSGVPTPPENMGYGEIRAENGFAFSLVGTMYQQEDGSLLLYLTNPEYRGCNLLCEIADADGRVIYRSGVVRPGEYVERLSPQAELLNEEMQIELKVYAFEPETWYSMGTVSLVNTLHSW